LLFLLFYCDISISALRNSSTVPNLLRIRVIPTMASFSAYKYFHQFLRHFKTTLRASLHLHSILNPSNHDTPITLDKLNIPSGAQPPKIIKRKTPKTANLPSLNHSVQVARSQKHPRSLDFHHSNYFRRLARKPNSHSTPCLQRLFNTPKSSRFNQLRKRRGPSKSYSSTSPLSTSSQRDPMFISRKRK